MSSTHPSTSTTSSSPNTPSSNPDPLPPDRDRDSEDAHLSSNAAELGTDSTHPSSSQPRQGRPRRPTRVEEEDARGRPSSSEGARSRSGSGFLPAPASTTTASGSAGVPTITATGSSSVVEPSPSFIRSQSQPAPFSAPSTPSAGIGDSEVPIPKPSPILSSGATPSPVTPEYPKKTVILPSEDHPAIKDHRVQSRDRTRGRDSGGFPKRILSEKDKDRHKKKEVTIDTSHALGGRLSLDRSQSHHGHQGRGGSEGTTTATSPTSPTATGTGKSGRPKVWRRVSVEMPLPRRHSGEIDRRTMDKARDRSGGPSSAGGPQRDEGGTTSARPSMDFVRRPSWDLTRKGSFSESQDPEKQRIKDFSYTGVGGKTIDPDPEGRLALARKTSRDVGGKRLHALTLAPSRAVSLSRGPYSPTSPTQPMSPTSPIPPSGAADAPTSPTTGQYAPEGITSDPAVLEDAELSASPRTSLDGRIGLGAPSAVTRRGTRKSEKDVSAGSPKPSTSIKRPAAQQRPSDMSLESGSKAPRSPRFLPPERLTSEKDIPQGEAAKEGLVVPGTEDLESGLGIPRQPSEGEETEGTTPIPSGEPLHLTLSLPHRDEVMTDEEMDMLEGPPLIHFNIWHRKWSILAYINFLIFTNLAIPCVIYYILENHTNMKERDLIGISSAALGISSCFDAPLRTYKLVRHRKLYGPLGDDVWWHLDATMWTYQFGLGVFAIPLAIAPATDPPITKWFLMSTACLIGPIGLVMLVSLFSPRVNKFWISSDPPGSQMKPMAFYFAEDVMAVDARHGREFRLAMRRRYLSSPPFRALTWQITLWWAFGSAFYVAATAVVTWLAPLWFSFAWVLGQLFVWLFIWAALTVVIMNWGFSREDRWWENRIRIRRKMVEAGGGFVGDTGVLGLTGVDTTNEKINNDESNGGAGTSNEAVTTVGVGGNVPKEPQQEDEKSKHGSEV